MESKPEKEQNESKEQEKENKETCEDDRDDVYCLGYNNIILLDVNKHAPSGEGTNNMKYSIDLPNVPKKKLETFLNSDLLDELEKGGEDSPDPPPIKDVSNYQNPYDQEIQIPLYPSPPFYKKNQNKKTFAKRKGDWICIQCQNLNFAFRTRCNRCGLDKSISEGKYFNPQGEGNS